MATENTDAAPHYAEDVIASDAPLAVRVLAAWMGSSIRPYEVASLVHKYNANVVCLQMVDDREAVRAAVSSIMHANYKMHVCDYMDARAANHCMAILHTDVLAAPIMTSMLFNLQPGMFALQYVALRSAAGHRFSVVNVDLERQSTPDSLRRAAIAQMRHVPSKMCIDDEVLLAGAFGEGTGSPAMDPLRQFYINGVSIDAGFTYAGEQHVVSSSPALAPQLAAAKDHAGCIFVEYSLAPPMQ